MVYSSFGSTAPLFTEQILSTIKLLPYLIFSTIFIVMVGCSVYILYFRKLPHMKRVKLCFVSPRKTFLILKHSHYFATQLSSLLHGGLSVLEALTIMMEQKYQPFFQYEAGRVKHQLIAGEPLQSIIAKSGYYEEELSYIITHGQANGNLAIELGDYSDLIMEKMEQKLNVC